MIIDLHNHTKPRSLDSMMTPDEAVGEARRLGLDAICLTEHDQPWDAALAAELSERHGMLVIPGMEVTTEEGHILVFGLDRYISGIHRFATLRENVIAAGGAMILAHPFRNYAVTPGSSDDRENRRLLEYAAGNVVLGQVDALEAQNGSGSESDNEFSTALQARTGMKGTGGSDAHSVREVALCATEFEHPIHDLQSLITTIKAGRYQAVRLRRKVHV